MGKERITTYIKVRYVDTDRMKRVYYSKYLEYFEVGRTDFLNHYYINYRKLEDKHSIYMPVLENYTKYTKPVEYDSELNLITSFEQTSHYKFKFTYELYHNEYIVAEGYTTHCFVNSENKKISFEEFLDLINK